MWRIVERINIKHAGRPLTERGGERVDSDEILLADVLHHYLLLTFSENVATVPVCCPWKYPKSKKRRRNQACRSRTIRNTYVQLEEKN